MHFEFAYYCYFFSNILEGSLTFNLKCIFLQSIDRVQKLEADFFPVLAGELGSSMEAANEYQQRLDNFMPEFEVNCSVVEPSV